MARTRDVFTALSHHANVYSGFEPPVTEGKQLFYILYKCTNNVWLQAQL